MNKTYTGSCHCQAVRFSAQIELKDVMSCNCSICSRAGWLLSFIPATSFKLESGKDQLTDYQFGKKDLHHPFCKHCGMHTFSHGVGPDGVETYAINARCLEDIDLKPLTITEFDGKSR